MAKTRKGGKAKAKPKSKAKPKAKPKARPPARKKGVGGAAPSMGGGRPRRPPMEIDPGYFILKQYYGTMEYEVGRVLVDGNTGLEHWFLYNLTQPTGGMNGYTYPGSVNQQYESTNVSTRFVYSGTSNVPAICNAVGSISTYKILSSSDGKC